MRTRVLLLLAGLALPLGLPSLVASGCGSSVAQAPAGAGGGGQGPGFGGDLAEGGGGTGGLPSFTDPGCPDAGPKTTMFTCDAFDQGNGDCPGGDGCYIFVDYPSGPCTGEVYGTICEPAGPGMEGDPCGDSTDCAAGLTCVVTGSGDQCVVLCKLTGPDDCPSGDVCQPIDVEGFGGCL